MNAHTPAPWFVNQYTNYTGFSIHAKDRGCIAERWYDKEQAPPYRDEIMANAKLIAAAPELLAALQRVNHKPHRGEYINDGAFVCAQSDFEFANAAIAKATCTS